MLRIRLSDIRCAGNTVALLIALALGCGSVFAAEHADLGAAATNPVSDLIQIRVQDQYVPDSYNVDGSSNAALIQTVVPFHLPFESVPMLVSRMTSWRS